MKILFALELGNGFGHIARLLPIAKGLSDLGHTISWVLPNSELKDKLSKNSCYRTLKDLIPPEKFVVNTLSLTHILYNLGYENSENLKNRIEEWHTIFEEENPDLLVFDYCPSLIMANLDTKIKMFQIGDGFTIPPQVKPYGVLLPVSFRLDDLGIKELIEAEDRFLSVLNSVSSGHDIKSLAQLYGTCNNAALLSYPELDHYGYRENTGYYGVMTKNGEQEFKKYRLTSHALVYIKDFPKVSEFVEILLKNKDLALSFHISEPSLPENIIRKIKKRKNTEVFFGPVNFASAEKNCDFVISHGNHTTTAQALSAGLPLLMIPIDSEKSMVTDRVIQTGAGLACTKNDSRMFSVKLNYFIDSNKRSKFTERAKAFKEKYSTFDPISSMKALIERIHNL